MKTQITLSTILLSLLMLFIIGCSDSGTNTPAATNELAGTVWKFVAYVEQDNNIGLYNIPQEAYEMEHSYMLKFYEKPYSDNPMIYYGKEIQRNLVATWGPNVDKILKGGCDIDYGTKKINIIHVISGLMIPKDWEMMYEAGINQSKRYMLIGDSLRLYYKDDEYMLFKRIEDDGWLDKLLISKGN